MTQANPSQRQHVLLYEPRTEGHHLGWLRFITEDLLSANFQLSIAADLRPDSRQRVEQELAGLTDRVKLLSAYDEKGQRHLDGRAKSVAHCLALSGADQVFLCALDEIASDCWRQATWGGRPPTALRGRMGGIYHRPRFLGGNTGLLDRWLKRPGFDRLLREGWWRQLLFVDEFLVADLQRAQPKAPLFFLPDTCPDGYQLDSGAARKQLGVPLDRKVFLFYGTGARRKGLPVAVAAMSQLPTESPAFLLCAGQQEVTGQTATDLERLVREGRALRLNRYVTVEEEKACFAASDAVLLPYLNHFGTSGVLSRAMSAGRPVIASDEQLMGRLTRERGLGLVFPSGDAAALRDRLLQATQFSERELAGFASATREHARRYSRAAFRATLIQSLTST